MGCTGGGGGGGGDDDDETGRSSPPDTSNISAEDFGTFDEALEDFIRELDIDAEGCRDSDLARCDELLQGAPGFTSYKEYGRTCGNQRTPTEILCVSVDWDERVFEINPDDENLARACEAGTMKDCDELGDSPTAPNELKAFGASCGHRDHPDVLSKCDQSQLSLVDGPEPSQIFDELFAQYSLVMIPCSDATAEGLLACDTLGLDTNAPGAYQLWARTCGGRLSQPADETCTITFGFQPHDPPAGNSARLNELAAQCFQDFADCDVLTDEAPDFDFAYDNYGKTCGGRSSAQLAPTSSCVDAFPSLERAPTTFEAVSENFEASVGPQMKGCHERDWVACTHLREDSTAGTLVNSYGATCGGIGDDDLTRDCASRFPPPWTPGTGPANAADAVIDDVMRVMNDCHDRGLQACDIAAASGGDAIAYGQTCGRRRAQGSEPCDQPTNLDLSSMARNFDEVVGSRRDCATEQDLVSCDELSALIPDATTYQGATWLDDLALSCGLPDLYESIGNCVARFPPTTALTPVETEPVETVPVETVPVETVPVETAPVETAPLDTMPVETSATTSESTSTLTTINSEELKPQNLRITDRDNGGRATITWEAPPHDGRVVYTPQVYVAAGEDGLADPLQLVTSGPSSSSTSWVFDAARSGVVYRFRVLAEADGAVGEAILDDVVLPKPFRPTRVSATDHDGDVTVTWDPPQSTDIRDYSIQAVPGDASARLLVPGDPAVRPTGGYVMSSGIQTSVTFESLPDGSWTFFITPAYEGPEWGESGTTSLTVGDNDSLHRRLIRVLLAGLLFAAAVVVPQWLLVVFGPDKNEDYQGVNIFWRLRSRKARRNRPRDEADPEASPD